MAAPVDYKPATRLDPYSTPQLIAAALVIAVPTVLSFVLGMILEGLSTAVLWAIVVGVVASSVIATSALIAKVGVFTAVLGISGVWGGAAAFALWIWPHCPAWIGQVCGPRQYATAIALGMLAPWAVTTFILPIPLFFRWMFRRLFHL